MKPIDFSLMRRLLPAIGMILFFAANGATFGREYVRHRSGGPSFVHNSTSSASAGRRMLYQTIRPGEELSISIDELRKKAVPSAKLPPPIEGRHPAVVRISATATGGSTFHGSGTLIAVSGKKGVILTNSHVIRGARNLINVRFPGGFTSTAEILAIDKTWDLAALLIERPGVEPVALSRHVPELGDPLTIAGYGGGNYRQASGWMIAYYAPDRNLPHEVLEISTGARFGDSGGPIFNEKGELAGVLFGSASNLTNGSHCGRVRIFLEEAFASTEDFSLPSSASPSG